MIRHAKGLVSALLPVVPLILCHACGGGSSDSAPTADTQAPATSVNPPSNGAPTISSDAEAFAQVGVTYNYQPMADDPDGDALSFSATNLPPWASLDPTNGRLSGTPGENDVGVYEAITITVADAGRRTASAPFSITVVAESLVADSGTDTDTASPPGTGIASLRWEIPAAKVDGSPLDDLAGYRILYGRSADELDQSVLISDPAVTSFEFTTLQSGIWYFAVVAVNAGGLEGPPTITAMKSI
jgi:hypothetical protein